MKRFTIAGVLLVVALTALAENPPSKPAGTGPASKPATRPAPAGQVIDSMLKAVQPANQGMVLNPVEYPTTDNRSGDGAVPPKAPTVQLRREGSYVVDRTGRLTQGADGQSWEFAFEADAQAMQDPPMVILPNLKLMQMENAVRGASRDLRFRITGIVTEYRGRNYIMMEKVMVVPEN